MIVSSRALAVLDQHRVPYELDPAAGLPGFGRLRAGRDGGAELLWAESRAPAGFYSFLGVPFAGSLATTEELDRAKAGRNFDEGAEITTVDGAPAANVLHAEDGSVLLPFDPDELIWGTLSEQYARLLWSRRLESARRAYYAMRGVMPRRTQMALRRRYARVQGRATFPSWPAETRLHGVLSWLLGQIEMVAGEPLPWIAPWPDGARWSFVLTHDVERRQGYEFVDRVLEVERVAGLRSAWYFVPERDYVVGDERVAGLVADGFEVGVHGLRHDGHDLDPRMFDERLPAMRSYAERWGAVGFRAPSTLRDWDLMPRTGFDYDSSYADVARYEPLPGGTCTWWPFFIGNLVELPLTLPMDHTLFELLGEDESGWITKIALLKRRGGMALMLTHPDYLRRRLDEYERVLDHVASDESVWHALPREVAEWWRARAASVPVRDGRDGAWTVHGPAAARGRVAFGLDHAGNGALGLR